MTTTYAIQAGHLSAAIYAGRLNADQTAFTDKQDRTDMTLAAVGTYVRDHFNGGMVADFPGMGFVLEVTVKPIDVGVSR